MLTTRQRRFLEKLHQFLEDNREHAFEARTRPVVGTERLVLRFPYGTGFKSTLDKDHRNFDYKIDALFNKKLREAMQIVVYFNSLFPRATEMTKSAVLREMQQHREQKKTS